jgi:hypothetical protein
VLLLVSEAEEEEATEKIKHDGKIVMRMEMFRKIT